MLRGRIRGSMNRWQLRVDGCDVDYSAALILKHYRQDSFREFIRSRQVQCESLVPKGIFEVNQWTRAGTASNTSVVNEDIDGPEY